MFDSGLRTRGILSAGLLAVTAGAIAVVESPAQAKPREHVVVMSGMSFGRVPADAKVGDTIVWVNRDSVPHSVTARNRSFDIRTGAGQSRRLRLTRAGVYQLYCIYHPAMRGTLKVSQ